MNFSGSKIVLHTHEKLVAYLRDDKPDIPFPGKWDLPGGGREGSECPTECALREVKEEFGLTLAPGRVVWSKCYPGASHNSLDSYFLALPLNVYEIDLIRFGDEGQRWQMMGLQEYLHHPNGISFLQKRLGDYLAAGR